MIVIAGDGIAAGVLHRVLGDVPHRIIKSQGHTTYCGIRSCGWGIARQGIDIIKSLGIEPPVLSIDDHIYFDDRKVNAELYSIDKPKLVKELLYDASFIGGASYGDMIVDATGFARAYIGPAKNDRVAMNYQMRVRANGGDEKYLSPSFEVIHGGYAWMIPLGGGEVHIGFGSATTPNTVMDSMFKDTISKTPGKILCMCREPIRLSGLASPIVKDGVVAIGEAAGTVVPLGGAGIASSMESALLLGKILRNGGDTAYTAYYREALETKFGVFTRQAEVLDGMLKDGRVRPGDYRMLHSAFKYMGIKPNIFDMVHIVRSMRHLTG